MPPQRPGGQAQWAKNTKLAQNYGLPRTGFRLAAGQNAKLLRDFKANGNGDRLLRPLKWDAKNLRIRRNEAAVERKEALKWPRNGQEED